MVCIYEECNLLDKILILTLGTAYLIYIYLNETTDISSVISTKHFLFVDITMAICGIYTENQTLIL